MAETAKGLVNHVEGQFDALDRSLDGLALELRRWHATIVTVGSIPYVAALGVAIAWLIRVLSGTLRAAIPKSRQDGPGALFGSQPSPLNQVELHA